jgi:hypothetical protein
VMPETVAAVAVRGTATLGHPIPQLAAHLSRSIHGFTNTSSFAISAAALGTPASARLAT